MESCIVGFNTCCQGNEKSVKNAWLTALRRMLSLPLELIHCETVVLLDRSFSKPKECVQIGFDAEDYYRIKDSEKEK